MKRLKRLTRKKYRITALVLALCMTLSLLPISALAAGTDLAGKAIEEGTFAATGGNVNYRIDGEEIVIPEVMIPYRKSFFQMKLTESRLQELK